MTLSLLSLAGPVLMVAAIASSQAVHAQASGVGGNGGAHDGLVRRSAAVADPA